MKRIGGQYWKKPCFSRSRGPIADKKNLSVGKNYFVHGFGLRKKYPTAPQKNDVHNDLSSQPTSINTDFIKQIVIRRKDANAWKRKANSIIGLFKQLEIFQENLSSLFSY